MLMKNTLFKSISLFTVILLVAACGSEPEAQQETIFYKKELLLPDEKEIEKIERVAKDLLEKNGYKQYEVSSWAKPGFESQHNLNYWQFGDFLGVGPGSHSKISNEREIIRYRKIKPLEGYIKNQRSTDLRAIFDNELVIT